MSLQLPHANHRIDLSLPGAIHNGADRRKGGGDPAAHSLPWSVR